MTDEPKSYDAMLQRERQRLSLIHMKRTVSLLAALRERFGDGVLEVATEHYGKEAREGWARLAAKHGSNSIDDLVNLLWEPMTAQGFEYSREEQADGTQMKCTRCHLNDLAQETGEPEVVHSITCATDPYIVEGFNPQMGFRRTKTLVQGHGCCDHFYYIKKQ